MFLLGFEETSDSCKFVTSSDRASKIVTELDSFHFSEGYDRIAQFMSRLRIYVDPEGKFYPKGFTFKTKDKIDILVLRGTAPVGRQTGSVTLETFFFHQDIDDWPRDTIEDNKEYLLYEERNSLVEEYKELSAYVESHFIEWTGLKSQLEIFKDELKSLGVTSITAN